MRVKNRANAAVVNNPSVGGFRGVEGITLDSFLSGGGGSEFIGQVSSPFSTGMGGGGPVSGLIGQGGMPFGPGGVALDQSTIQMYQEFLNSALEARDNEIYYPFERIYYMDYLPIRGDISIATAFSSFRTGDYMSSGSDMADDLPFVSQEAYQIPLVSTGMQHETNPVYKFALGGHYSLIDLAQSNMIGSNIDTEQVDAIRRIYNHAADMFGFIGSPKREIPGLYTLPFVTPITATESWETAAPEVIREDFFRLLDQVGGATDGLLQADTVLLPYDKYRRISETPFNEGTDVSILEWVQRNNPVLNGLTIGFTRFGRGRGATDTDRAVAYVRDRSVLRFPLSDTTRTDIQRLGIHLQFYYLWAMAPLEVIRSQGIAYMDGI